MAKAKTTEEVEVTDKEAVPVASTTKENKTSVTVTWHGQSRVYSKAVHGENFLDLANEFAEKKGGEDAGVKVA